MKLLRGVRGTAAGESGGSVPGRVPTRSLIVAALFTILTDARKVQFTREGSVSDYFFCLIRMFLHESRHNAQSCHFNICALKQKSDNFKKKIDNQKNDGN